MSSKVKDSVLQNFSQKRILRAAVFFVPSTFVLLIVGIPIFFFVWASFWSTSPGFGGEFTLQGYRLIFQSSAVRTTLTNTLILGIVATLVALITGIITMIFSLKLAVSEIVKKVAVITMLLQLVLPSLIQAIAWDFYASPQGPLNQFLMLFPFIKSPPISINIWLIAFVLGTHYSGLVYLLVAGAVKSVPASLEEAGYMNGANTMTVFSRITFRLTLPSLMIAAAVVFTRSIQSFGVPLILGLEKNIFVVSTLMFLELREYPVNFNFVSALGIFILLGGLGGLLIQRIVTGSEEKYETIVGGGEGSTPLEIDAGKYSSLFTWIYLTFIFVVYIGPVLVLIMASFQQVFVGFKFELVQWSIRPYTALFVGEWSSTFRTTVVNTLIVGLMTGGVGILLSTMVSYLSVKTDSALGTILDYLTFAPIAIPGIILSSALLWLLLEYWNAFGLYGTLWLLIIAYIAKFILYGVRATNSALRAIGTELEEAARISGAGTITVFRRIYGPLTKSGLAAGFLIMFIDSTKILVMPLLLAPDHPVFQTAIWIFLRNAEGSIAAAMSVLLMVLLVGVYGILYYHFNVDLASL